MGVTPRNENATKKFEPRWLGPFKVVKKLSDVNYAIQRSKSIEGDELPLNSRLPLTGEVVHKNRLKRFRRQDEIEEEASQPDEELHTQDPPIMEAESQTLLNETITDFTERKEPTEETVDLPNPESSQPRYTLRRVIRPPERLDLL